MVRVAINPRKLWISPVTAPAADHTVTATAAAMFNPTRSINNPASGAVSAYTIEKTLTTCPYW